MIRAARVCTQFPYTTLFRSVDGKNVQQLYKIQMPYLTFVDETKVAGNNGCNNIAGSYTLDGKSISFHTDDFKSTRMFCQGDRKSTRLNSSHVASSYAVFCLK